MLELKTLLNKDEFTKPNGDTVVDLIRRAVSFLNVRSNVGTPYLVTEDYVMRPDLIAYHFYGEAGAVDLLLKYNGYSNPFAIDVDDFFKIPESGTLSKFGSKPKLSDLNSSRKKKSNVVFAPKSKKDKARIEYLLSKQNAAPPVPPNVAIQDGVKVLNSKIVYGADVTNLKKEDCPEPISRAKLKETLIKNKIGTS
jgi:hypothetical protein